MSPALFPSRPRLADHAVVRRHRVGDEDFWVLHDQRSGLAYRLGAREWGLLAQADGSRDLEGIVAAASRASTFAKVETLRAFLAALHEAGLLAEGVAPLPEPKVRGASRRLDPLPGFSLACDGRGSCCRLYASVIFRPVEEAYARALLPRVLDAGDHPERAFTPLQGSSACGASSVPLVDGRCAYLDGSGLCRLHAAQGAHVKPLGCQTFPALFVDDGEAVRVAPAVECACVLASALDPQPKGALLVPEGAQSSADLDEGILIVELPETLLLAPGKHGTRADLVRFMHAVVDAPAPIDTAHALAALASSVETSDLDPAAATRALAEPAPLDVELLRPFFAALASHASRRARIDATYRAEHDLARHAVRWIEAASRALAEDPTLAAPASSTRARAEAFYLRAGAHAYQLVSSDLPLAHALRDRAARILLARALPLVITRGEAQNEPALAHPLALVEATLRGHGLDAYAHDVPGSA
ncbi:YkgJ family cysteine cluster protein [Polyangium jinanense]|uniref:YkgJ family cysteine cluster protein n=1 Tax=Polyangium jinanense TaxID=2829994 RepID=A0A9X4B0R7_9BACT|nr:YkgJ family cysteine cluster protein [Polyangium jinanense]MDC3962904.1 YkgJ family cysteine cluster protein [Polyangium jinanense]MDC3989437.1 YkgJ family cysteine cluster protein [Polyangium jinanense]